MNRTRLTALALLPLRLLWIEPTWALLFSEPTQPVDLLARCLFFVLTLALTWLGGPVPAPEGN